MRIPVQRRKTRIRHATITQLCPKRNCMHRIRSTRTRAPCAGTSERQREGQYRDEAFSTIHWSWARSDYDAKQRRTQ